MLFRKKIEPRCVYCHKAQQINEEQFVCPKRGIVSGGYHCRHFDYDPLKRVPPQEALLDFSKLKDEDFSL